MQKLFGFFLQKVLRDFVHEQTEKSGDAGLADSSIALANESEQSKLQEEEMLAERPLRMLVVDDLQINQMVIRKQLEQLGHQVDLVGNGVQAIELATTRSYDLILTDLQMPNMSGLELVQNLRKAGIDIPIVAVTASIDDEVRMACREAGINACLTKPVPPVIMRGVLDHFPTVLLTFNDENGGGLTELSLTEVLSNDLRELCDALCEEDLGRYTRRLHALSGALAGIDQPGLSKACCELEQKAKKLGLDAIKVDWLKLQTQLWLLITHFKK